MFHEVWELEMFQTANVTLRSIKVIGNGVIRWATYDFLLVFNCSFAPFSGYYHLFPKI